MLNKTRRKNKTGFTLVEILVVILVIGMLFVMLVPRLSSIDESSRQAGVKQKFKEFQNAATSVMLENSGLNKVMSSNTDVAGLIAALNKELDDTDKFDTSTIQGQYCDSNAVDPWNNHYRLHVNDNTITFISYGSNTVTVHAAEFDYDTENCKYISVVVYSNGEVFINTKGFTVNIEEGSGESNDNDSEQIASTPEECFSWNGTTITGFSGTCGHTAAEHANIVIPDRCTAIGGDAFYERTNLVSVTIPDSVTSIDNYAFQYCYSLSNITIPNSVTYIGQSAFDACTSLTSITIPSGITSISRGAFSFCQGLTNIVIPGSVTSIGMSAFQGCINLTSVEIPNSVTYIGQRAFGTCDSLTNITIPNSVTSIDKNAFSGCTSLANIVIPNSVTSIGKDAFYGVPHIEYHGTASRRPWGALSMN